MLRYLGHPFGLLRAPLLPAPDLRLEVVHKHGQPLLLTDAKLRLQEAAGECPPPRQTSRWLEAVGPDCLEVESGDEADVDLARVVT